MFAVQFDLFDETPDDVTILKRELREVRGAADRLRRGLFSRHNELAKLYVELSHRVDIIERAICHPAAQKSEFSLEHVRLK